jgi:hypothetical protein
LLPLFPSSNSVHLCIFIWLLRFLLLFTTDVVFIICVVVGNSRSDEGAVTDEMDADGFITVRTKREKRAIKYSNTVERDRSENSNCKSVSRVILLKQSS